MKKMLPILTLLAFSFNFSFTSSLAKQTIKRSVNSEPLYQENFESVTINETNTVDKATGFIWANDYLNTKTKTVNRNKVLHWSVFNSNEYSIIGGFGLGDKGNLSRLKVHESYQVDCDFEMVNIQKVFIEVLGDQGKWGSIIIDANHNVWPNSGGNNMVNVSYQNSHVSFTFAMSYVTSENQNGYIKFTAYNSQSGYVNLDNVIIKKTTYAMDDLLEQYPSGVVNLNSLHVPFYQDNEISSTSSFVNINNSKLFKSEFTLNDALGKSIFYINDLGFIIPSREYLFSFDLDLLNVSQFSIYYGGIWMSNPSYVTLNNGVINHFGPLIKNATYVDKKITITFQSLTTFSQESDYKQFQIMAQTHQFSQPSYITIDNLRFKLQPIIESIEVDKSLMQLNYSFNQPLDINHLKVYAKLSDETTRLLDSSEYTISGFDSAVMGLNIITVSYQTFQTTFTVTIVRQPSSLRLNTTQVQKHYQYGENINLNGLVVEAIYLDGGTNLLLDKGALFGGYSVNLNGFDPYRSGTYFIEIIYQDVRANFEVEIMTQSSIVFADITYRDTSK